MAGGKKTGEAAPKRVFSIFEKPQPKAKAAEQDAAKEAKDEATGDDAGSGGSSRPAKAKKRRTETSKPTASDAGFADNSSAPSKVFDLSSNGKTNGQLEFKALAPENQQAKAPQAKRPTTKSKSDNAKSEAAKNFFAPRQQPPRSPAVVDLTLSPPPKPAPMSSAPDTFSQLAERRNARLKGKRVEDAVAAGWPSRGEAHIGLPDARWEFGTDPSRLGRRERVLGAKKGGKGKQRGEGYSWMGNWATTAQSTASSLDCAPQLCRISLSDIHALLPPLPGRSRHPLVSRLLASFEPPGGLKYDSPVLLRQPQRPREGQLWTTTYAPRSANEMLGDANARNAQRLRKWVQEVEVRGPQLATEPTSQDSIGRKRKAGSQLGGPSKRARDALPRSITRRVTKRPRRRKGIDSDDELDDFIVYDDEDDEDEIVDFDDLDRDAFTEENEDIPPGAERSTHKRRNFRVVETPPSSPSEKSRSGAAPTTDVGFDHLTNLMVLAGPTGSGKTCAVYAVAEELGWGVFEVNAGSLRSRRELERLVGDVGRNHTLPGAGKGGAPERQPGGVKSPRKKSGLATLFEKQGQKRPDVITLDDDEGPVKTRAVNGASTASRPNAFTSMMSRGKSSDPNSASSRASPPPFEPTNQSRRTEVAQSLILLEEVDVLYAQDKDFWNGVVEFVASSMRPVVITCTDLNTIPFDSLPIQEVLNFEPLPADLVAEYFEAVCLNEGHIIPRNNLRALYERHRYDVPPDHPPTAGGAQLPHPMPSQSAPQLDIRRSLLQLQFWAQWAIRSTLAGVSWLDLEDGKEGRATFSEGRLPSAAWQIANEDLGLLERVNETLGRSSGRGSGEEDPTYLMECSSFVDAFVDRSASAYLEVFEGSGALAEADDILAPEGIADLKFLRRIDASSVEAASTLDREMAVEALALAHSVAGSGKLDRDEKGFLRQRRQLLHDAELITQFLPPRAPALPDPVIVTDYLAAIRQLVAADDLRQAVFAQDVDEGRIIGFGTRRSARLNGPSYNRHLPILPKTLELVRSLRPLVDP